MVDEAVADEAGHHHEVIAPIVRPLAPTEVAEHDLRNNHVAGAELGADLIRGPAMKSPRFLEKPHGGGAVVLCHGRQMFNEHTTIVTAVDVLELQGLCAKLGWG